MSAILPAGAAPPRLGPHRVADYDRLPDEPRCELVFGRFHVTPSPFPRHQIVLPVLWQHFGRIAKAAGGIVFIAPLDVVLADHSVVQPDLLYVSAARLDLVGNRIEGAPDLVVEVLSGGTARYDRGTKLQLYALHGIEEYWLVDHERRQIDFLINDAGNFVAAPAVGGKYRSARLPEIHLDLSKLWRQVDAWMARVPRAR
ncbi:MAG TPA: Uma2 family endonuclease [Thermoanaerobaculia bacterium]|nr:Uma2 family endonuclease [Thermoanaerobaculia bacterium]